MQTNPYIFFNGQCEAGLNFYQQCLGAKIEALMKYAGTPAAEDVPSDWRDKVLHAKLTVGETTFQWPLQRTAPLPLADYPPR